MKLKHLKHHEICEGYFSESEIEDLEKRCSDQDAIMKSVNEDTNSVKSDSNGTENNDIADTKLFKFNFYMSFLALQRTF